MKEDTQNKIGKTFTEAERDAIHIAVLPAIAEHNFMPGDHVGYKGGKAVAGWEPIGIIDPFIEKVLPGQKCFIFLYPNTITTLRHQWTHPSIPDDGIETVGAPIDKAASEAWLRDWIESADCPDYETTMAALQGSHLPDTGANEDVYYKVENYGDGPYLFFSNRDAHSSIPDEFWHHFEVVTGQKVPKDGRIVGFSCSC